MSRDCSELSFNAIIGSRAMEKLCNGKNGRILGVFSSACYCGFDEPDSIMLHDACYGEIPFGIGLSNIKQFLKLTAVAPNMNCYFSDGCMFLPDGCKKIRFMKQHTGLTPNDDSIAVPESILTENLSYVKDILIVRSNASGIAGLAEADSMLVSTKKEMQAPSTLNAFCMAGFSSLAKLFEALKENEPLYMRNALDSLLGLGIGLTPSMDDFLAGFIYTFNFFLDKYGEAPESLSILNGLVMERSIEKTSAISATYLRSAARFDRFPILDNAIKNILEIDIKREGCAALECLLKVGSSSGSDMLTGIYFAIKMIALWEL